MQIFRVINYLIYYKFKYLKYVLQVVACLRNPLRLKRSKRRADSTNHRPHLKQIKTEAKSPVRTRAFYIQHLRSLGNGITFQKRTVQSLAQIFVVFSKVPGDINTFEGSSSSGNGLINVRTSLTENSVLNGSPSPTNANGISFIRSASNGDVGMDITDNGISVSSNGDVLNSEKSVLIEDIVQTLRETYERMPAHLLQYELAKAKALLSVKFT